MMEFEGQFEGEEIEMMFRRHPIVMRKGLILVGVFMVLGSLFGLFTSGDSIGLGEFLTSFGLPVIVGLAVGMIPFMYYWIGWHYTFYIVTNMRMIQFKQTGLFKSRSINDISLDRILSVNSQVKGITETILGFGTIIVQTMTGDFIISKVSRPARIQQHISAIIRDNVGGVSE